MAEATEKKDPANIKIKPLKDLTFLFGGKTLEFKKGVEITVPTVLKANLITEGVINA